MINNENINDEINKDITIEEIDKIAKTLKNNKAHGVDDIINEHIKTTLPSMKHIYVKLFNLILNTSIIPESWTIGIINPIYKNKGTESDAANYRPITLLSCLGKFFTAIINSRLQKYTESHSIINDYQTGFRSGFSTVDNMFILHSLIQILQKKKKKLFCAFIDLKQAFDSIWRAGLWSKLINNNINGKCLNLIKSLYACSRQFLHNFYTVSKRPIDSL